MNIDDYLTTKQAKDFCAVPCVPYKAFGLDFPKPVKIGRQNFYAKEDIAEWLKALHRARERHVDEAPQHRRAAVCAECGQSWPCDTALPKTQRCQAITSDGQRCSFPAKNDGFCRMHRYQW